ncbi:MAG: penicillin-binding protein activator [Halorhodospira sp.]
MARTILMTSPKRLLQLCATTMLLAAVYSCAPLSPEGGTSPQQLQTRAEEARAAGDYEQAGALYDEAAEASAEDAERRSRASIAAARSWLQAERPQAAADALARVERDSLDTEARTRLDLTRAELLLMRDTPESAAALLEALPPLPSDEAALYHRLRAETAEALGDPLSAVAHRVKLAPNLQTKTTREANQAAIWKALSEAPARAIQQAKPSEDDYGGWLRLAQIARSHRLDPEQLEAAIARWEQRYPEHPARQHQAPKLLTRFRERIQEPERIGLLLPLSGDLRDAGRAVRDGVLIAHFHRDKQHPEVTVYDTGGDPEQARAAFEEARDDGHEVIIGPLTRSAVEAVAEARGDTGKPVLALNQLSAEETPPQEAFFQFGLRPEEEARQAAELARERGWRTAIILAPRNDWGERLEEAFHEAFEADDGIILQSEGYDPKDTDFSGPIREALNLRISERRHEALSRTLGESPEHEPRRRQDVDAIFLAAFPRQGRLLRPQLEYHHAPDVPVLATSHVYSGHPQPEQDRDLDGLLFLDSPWLLERSLGVPEALTRAQLDEQLEGVMERHARLVGLGIDAYRVLPYLEVLAEHPEERLDGLTGALHMSEGNILKRRLTPARFANGRPKLEPPPKEGNDESAETTETSQGDRS